MRQVLLDPAALEDLQWWLRHDHRTARKILAVFITGRGRRGPHADGQPPGRFIFSNSYLFRDIACRRPIARMGNKAGHIAAPLEEEAGHAGYHDHHLDPG